MPKYIKNYLSLFFSLLLLCSFVYLSLYQWKLLNEDIYQIYNGVENIIEYGDLKNRDEFFIEGFKNGANFSYFNEKWESIASKFPSGIMYYSFLTIVPGINLFYYINIFLWVVLVAIYYLIFRNFSSKKYFWIIPFIGSNGLFIAYSTYYFESVLFGMLLVLWFYYYFSNHKKYLWFFLIATVQVIRPEYWLISLILAAKELFFKKNPTYLFMSLVGMIVVVGVNYKLTGYFNFLNAGISEIDSNTGLRIEKNLVETILAFTIIDWKLGMIGRHLIFLSKDLIFLSPFLLFFAPSFLARNRFSRRIYHIHIWLLLCVLFLYSNRSYYYGFMQTNYYSSFVRYSFPALMYFILMWTVLFYRTVSNRIFFMFVVSVSLFYSLLLYTTWGPNINYSLPSRLNITKVQIFNMSTISSLIPKESLILSDGTMDKFSVFSGRPNIIQFLFLDENETATNFLELISLKSYIEEDIYLLYSFKNSTRVDTLLIQNNFSADIIFSNNNFIISRFEK